MILLLCNFESILIQFSVQKLVVKNIFLVIKSYFVIIINDTCAAYFRDLEIKMLMIKYCEVSTNNSDIHTSIVKLSALKVNFL